MAWKFYLRKSISNFSAVSSRTTTTTVLYLQEVSDLQQLASSIHYYV